MGYTQPELAKKLRTTKAVLLNIEQGRTPASEEFLMAFSEFTKIPLSEIKTGMISMNSIVFTKETETKESSVYAVHEEDMEPMKPTHSNWMSILQENNALLKDKNNALVLENNRLREENAYLKAELERLQTFQKD